MQVKKRPYSSKPVSSIPIIIDESRSHNNSDSDMKQAQSIPNNPPPHARTKLNHIIPQLPQFGIKTNNTALLYSKFIVKGLKEDKLSIVRSAFRKKQEATQAPTLSKNRNKSITRMKTGELLDNFMENEQIDENNHNVQLNTLLRASSAKVFRKNNLKEETNVDNQFIERTLSKNQTQLNLHKGSLKKRPTTAKIFRERDSRFSHGMTKEQQIKNQEKQSRRPTTATNGRQTKIMTTIQMGFEKSMYSEQLTNLVAKKIKDMPIRVETIQNVDHIERNKQNISSYNRKTSSIYLTNTNLEQIMRNRKESTRKLQEKPKSQKKSTFSQHQIKPQQVFIHADKARHQQKIQQIQTYLQQSLPSKLQLITQELRKQHKKTHTQQTNENYQQLVSINLDNGFEQNHSQLNQRSAKACFDDYIQNCQILQYNISSKLKSEHVGDGNHATLNICQCRKVIEIYKAMVGEKDQQKKLAKVEEIREITKNLKYFSHKPKQEIDKFFAIPFEIVIADEEYVVIELNSAVEFIYIILNGSAMVEANFNNQFELPQKIFGEKLLNNQHSLYDGEIFGEPSKPSQKHYKMRVALLEQSLLLKIKYQDYIAKFFQGSEVEEKLDVLNVAFKIEINRGLLTEEDLQILSLSLEKHRYPSKSLIYRQGQIFDKLVIVAKGKLAGINQYILEQDKVRISDMKQLDKNIRQQKQNTRGNLGSEGRKFVGCLTQPDLEVDKLSVSRMRRQNLINYEVLRQDTKKLHYYFIKEQMEFVKGDSINWKPLFIEFKTSSKPHNSYKEDISKTGMLPIKPVSFSLMSNSNDTQVYFLSRSAFQYLPNNIKKVLLNKGQQQQNRQIKPESEKQIRSWNNYKQKLCNSIIKQHQQKVSKNKF